MLWQSRFRMKRSTLLLACTSAAVALMVAGAVAFYAPPRASRAPPDMTTQTTGAGPGGASTSPARIVERVEAPATIPPEILRHPDDPPEDGIWPDEPLPGPAAKRETAAAAPTDCLPGELRAVLTDIQGRFSPVMVVSTTKLHTDNHSPDSTREKLHHACQAVDIKTAHPAAEVMAYLRSRPEVGGVNTYRNGVIHFDFNSAYAARTGAAPAAQSTRAPQRIGASEGRRKPSGAALPSIFTPPATEDPAIRAYRGSR